MTFQEKVDHAKRLIAETLKKHQNTVMACSFGKDSLVLLHLINEVKQGVPVFSVLADTEFPQTFALRDKIVNDWKPNYKEYNFVNDPARGADDCCRSLKVEKFKEALAPYECWFSAIRADEGVTRANFEEVEEKDGLIKVNPILHFSEKDVWRYTAIHNLPVNEMYREGYRSLSCRLCSSKELDETEPERAGRWKGTSHEGGECGIHTQSLRKSS